MRTTFDDFIELAAERLERAALAITDGARIGAATCRALSTANRSLIEFARRYGPTVQETPAAGWIPRYTDLLAEADRKLCRHGSQAGAQSSADELIGDAARFLVIARDLVATHLTVPDPPGWFARTPVGADILDGPLREQLLCHTAGITAHLAETTRIVAVFDDLGRRRPHTADAYRPRGRDLQEAAHALAEAATFCPAPVLTGSILYPRPGEDPAVAAEEIGIGLERLATAAYQAANRLRTHERPPAHTAGDLRASATNLAIAHALAADLLARLAPYLPARPGLIPAQVAGRLRAAGAAWAALSDQWQQTRSVPDSGPRSPLTVQALSVATRFGRLLYTDPTWTTLGGPAEPRAVADLLAPHVLDAVCRALSSLPRSAATIAADHARLVNTGAVDLYCANRSQRPEHEGRRFYPLQPAQRAAFTAGYQTAAHRAGQAAAGLAPLGRGHQAAKAAALMDAPRVVVKSGFVHCRPTRSSAERSTALRPHTF
jgi:hypothetical protein